MPDMHLPGELRLLEPDEAIERLITNNPQAQAGSLELDAALIDMIRSLEVVVSVDANDVLHFARLER